MPLTSVVIPCYNAAPYVAEAIESALGQAYGPVEVVVIDDGSTDRSLEVLQSFGDTIRYESGPNRGPSAARNRGVQLAKGELIQFLDADDVLHPDKLARQVPFALHNRPAISYCDYEKRERDQPQYTKVHSWECGQTDPVVFIVRTPSLSTAAPLHWKSVLQQAGGFRDHLLAAEEYELHLRLAYHGFRFVHLPEVLYTVLKTPRSISSDYSGMMQAMYSVLCSTIEYLDDSGGLTSVRRLAFAEKLAGKAHRCFENGTDQIGTLFLQAARRTHPAGKICLRYPRAVKKLRRLCGLPVAERLLTLLAGFHSMMPTVLNLNDKACQTAVQSRINQ